MKNGDDARLPSECVRRLAIVAFAAGLCGCAGWARVLGGPTYSAQGRDGRSGTFVAIDTLMTPKPHTVFNASPKPLPFAVHVGLEAQLTPNVKTFSWLTGIATLKKPRPVAGYLIAGTNFHVDQVDGRASFGNFHPYGEAGVAAELSPKNEEDNHGFIFTLGIGASYFIHYAAILDGKGPKTDTFLLLKFGLGYELY